MTDRCLFCAARHVHPGPPITCAAGYFGAQLQAHGYRRSTLTFATTSAGVALARFITSCGIPTWEFRTDLHDPADPWAPLRLYLGEAPTAVNLYTGFDPVWFHPEWADALVSVARVEAAPSGAWDRAALDRWCRLVRPVYYDPHLRSRVLLVARLGGPKEAAVLVRELAASAPPVPSRPLTRLGRLLRGIDP